MKGILPHIFSLLAFISTANAQDIEFAGYSWSNADSIFTLSDSGALGISPTASATTARAIAEVDELERVTHWNILANITCNVSNSAYMRIYLSESQTEKPDGFYLRIGTNSRSISLVRSSNNDVIIKGKDGMLPKDNAPFAISVEVSVVRSADGISHFALQSTVESMAGNASEKNDTAYSLKISDPKYMMVEVKFSTNNRGFFINAIETEKQPIESPSSEEPQPKEPQLTADSLFYRGCVVINEIMANPNAELGLPSKQYVELYNTTDSAINITNWLLTINSTSAPIGNCILPPDGYVVVCSKSAEPEMSAIGATVTTQKALTLTKNSGRVVLRNLHGQVADYVDYNINMYGATFKADGGWSLERIDPFNLSVDVQNFVPSTSEKGGTPSARNSADGTLPDETAPHIVSISSNATGDTLHLTLSEPIDTATFKSTFFINDAEKQLNIVASDDVTLARFSIALSQPMQRHKTYQVSGVEATDYAGNAIVGNVATTAIAEKAMPKQIVINEIMATATPAINDYIEIYNNSEETFDLYDVCFGLIKNEQLSSCNRICNYSRLFFPDDYIVVCADSAALVEAYNVPNKQWIVSNTKFGNLPAEGEVAISNILGEIIDNVPYNEKMHSQLITDTHNVALERILTNAASDASENWTSASALSGYATPTAINSQNRDNRYRPTTNIEQVVRRFTPNADGEDDNMVLSTNFAEGEWIATMRIYTPNGVLIAIPYNNTPLPVSGELIWNGQNTQGATMPYGTYIVLVSVWQTGGKKYEWKGTCTIGEDKK